MIQKIFTCVIFANVCLQLQLSKTRKFNMNAVRKCSIDKITSGNTIKITICFLLEKKLFCSLLILDNCNCIVSCKSIYIVFHNRIYTVFYIKKHLLITVTSKISFDQLAHFQTFSESNNLTCSFKKVPGERPDHNETLNFLKFLLNVLFQKLK